MATHSGILAWKIPRTEDPGRLQFMGSQSQTQMSVCTHTHTHTHTLSFPVVSSDLVKVRHVFLGLTLRTQQIPTSNQ